MKRLRSLRTKREGKIIFAIILILIIVFSVAINLNLPKRQDNTINEEYIVEFDVNAELTKSDNWRFYMNFTIMNNGNATFHVSWCWYNISEIKYLDGNADDVGITGNITSLLHINPNQSNTLSVIITEYGFTSEPSEVWGNIMIRIRETSEIVPFNFNLNTDKGITKGA